MNDREQQNIAHVTRVAEDNIRKCNAAVARAEKAEADFLSMSKLAKHHQASSEAALKIQLGLEAERDRLQELLDSTIAQLKRTQDDRDQRTAQVAAVIDLIRSYHAPGRTIALLEKIIAHIERLVDVEYVRADVSEDGPLMKLCSRQGMSVKSSETLLLLRSEGIWDADDPYPTRKIEHDRAQELLESTKAQLKRTQDDRDKYMTQLALVKEMCEMQGGCPNGLRPDQSARVLALNDVNDLLDSIPKSIQVLDAEYMGENTYGEFRYKDGYKVLIRKSLPRDVEVKVLVMRAGGPGDAVHPDPTPTSEESP
jgi:hypothetical protein